MSLLALITLLITAALAWFGPSLLSRPKTGTLIFILGAVVIFALVALYVSVVYVVLGAIIGLGARFLRWIALKLMGQGKRADSA